MEKEKQEMSMQVQPRDVLRKHWSQLMQLTEVNNFANMLVSYNKFTETDISNLFGGTDELQNKEKFLTEIITKQDIDEIFDLLLRWLKMIGHDELARSMCPKTFGVGEHNNEVDEDEDDDKFSTSIETESPQEFDQSMTPLEINVIPATEFMDTQQHNPNVPFYHCRSKKRGRVLIINNYDFPDTNHDPRTGAGVDETNLNKLFNQMGGWEITIVINKTAEQMRAALKQFATEKPENSCDICFVFIMSHGSEDLNTTIVYGSDGKYLRDNEIEDYFINKNCPLFKGKPKVIIYQVCRGHDLDIGVTEKTQYDGKCNHRNVTKKVGQESVRPVSRRPVEDMLIGHATMQGSKAHRDPFRGTWYIELICKNFMKFAKVEPVDNLLMKVDSELRKRVSEYNTVQTSEQTVKGFNKLYLNPGIFEEDGKLKEFKRPAKSES